jgi:hypothetical protein
MQHRKEFTRLVLDQMGHWIESRALADCDHRARIVHGAAYASFGRPRLNVGNSSRR